MALKDFKLTNSGDVELNTLAQPTVLYGKDAIDQLVRAALSLWKGNWFRDTKRGVDWLGVMKLQYGKNEIIDKISSALKRVVYIDEVVDVGLKVDRATRVATISYTVKAFGKFITGKETV